MDVDTVPNQLSNDQPMAQGMDKGNLLSHYQRLCRFLLVRHALQRRTDNNLSVYFMQHGDLTPGALAATLSTAADSASGLDAPPGSTGSPSHGPLVSSNSNDPQNDSGPTAQDYNGPFGGLLVTLYRDLGESVPLMTDADYARFVNFQYEMLELLLGAGRSTHPLDSAVASTLQSGSSDANETTETKLDSTSSSEPLSLSTHQPEADADDAHPAIGRPSALSFLGATGSLSRRLSDPLPSSMAPLFPRRESSLPLGLNLSAPSLTYPNLEEGSHENETGFETQQQDQQGDDSNSGDGAGVDSLQDTGDDVEETEVAQDQKEEDQSHEYSTSADQDGYEDYGDARTVANAASDPNDTVFDREESPVPSHGSPYSPGPTYGQDSSSTQGHALTSPVPLKSKHILQVQAKGISPVPPKDTLILLVQAIVTSPVPLKSKLILLVQAKSMAPVPPKNRLILLVQAKGISPVPPKDTLILLVQAIVTSPVPLKSKLILLVQAKGMAPVPLKNRLILLVQTKGISPVPLRDTLILLVQAMVKAPVPSKANITLLVQGKGMAPVPPKVNITLQALAMVTAPVPPKVIVTLLVQAKGMAPVSLKVNITLLVQAKGMAPVPPKVNITLQVLAMVTAPVPLRGILILLLATVKAPVLPRGILILLLATVKVAPASLKGTFILLVLATVKAPVLPRGILILLALAMVKAPASLKGTLIPLVLAMAKVLVKATDTVVRLVRVTVIHMLLVQAMGIHIHMLPVQVQDTPPIPIKDPVLFLVRSTDTRKPLDRVKDMFRLSVRAIELLLLLVQVQAQAKDSLPVQSIQK
ncbi:hypothetical protein BGZ94_007607 [Podila epigama]|nr:hypothetical protein BGZ94_007607 [Podila epigama]